MAQKRWNLGSTWIVVSVHGLCSTVYCCNSGDLVLLVMGEGRVVGDMLGIFWGYVCMVILSDPIMPTLSVQKLLVTKYWRRLSRSGQRTWSFHYNSWNKNSLNTILSWWVSKSRKYGCCCAWDLRRAPTQYIYSMSSSVLKVTECTDNFSNNTSLMNAHIFILFSMVTQLGMWVTFYQTISVLVLKNEVMTFLMSTTSHLLSRISASKSASRESSRNSQRSVAYNTSSRYLVCNMSANTITMME